MPTSKPSFCPLHYQADLLADFAQKQLEHDENRHIGSSLRIPRGRLAYNKAKIREWAEFTDYQIADPETRQLVLPYEKRGFGRDDYRYLRESNPIANSNRFVKNVLQAQIDTDSDALVSASLIHGLTGNNRNLNATLDFAKRSAENELTEGKDLLVGLDVTDEIWANPESRDVVLNAVVEELPGKPIFLKTTLVHRISSRRQYDQAGAISGLKAAISSLVENGHEVMLPQSGLLGWLMLGFGARSFGAGVPGTLQRCDVPSPSSGGGGSPELHWFFYEPLLSFVLVDEVDALNAELQLEPCTCPFCEESPPTPGVGFDKAAAGLHFLWGCMALVDELDGTADDLARVTNRLLAAEQNWSQVQESKVQIDERSKPKHLEAWTRAVA